MHNSSKYNKIFDNLPVEIVNHLKQLIKETDLPSDTNNFNRFIESWLAKRGEFNRIIEKGSYKKEEIFKSNNKNSFIAMTISGSLVSLGPLENDKRKATYTSIGVRKDVPMVKVSEDSELESDVEINKSIIFKKGPVRSTSIILEIAVMTTEVEKEQQISELSSANDFLLKRFIDINVDFLSNKYKTTDLIHRDDLFDKWIILKWIRMGGIEEYIYLARTKVLWLELFQNFYEHLTWEKFPLEKRDEIFLDLINDKFVKFIDIHKWFESETQDFDMGVLAGLETIPGMDSYKEFRNEFFKKHKM